MSSQDDQAVQTQRIAALSRYLPSSLRRQCLAGDHIAAVQPCIDHLRALLHTVSTYLPRQVVAPLMVDPHRPKIEGEFTYGTVMFADISGFTAMSEKLSQLGKEGAEEITAIVNRFFAALLQVTDRHGGDLLKFGGDALLVYFGGDAHALHACQAALEMQESMSRFSETETSQGTFFLQMTIGLGTGKLFMAQLGSAQNGQAGIEFAVMGQTMAHMALAEDLASAGEIFVDQATRTAVADRAQFGRTQEDYALLVGLHTLDREAPAETKGSGQQQRRHHPHAPPDAAAAAQLDYFLERIQALELFLPPGLMAKIALEPERIAIGGEYRPVTVLFCNFYGIDEIIEQLGETRSAEITAILNAHFRTMRQIIDKYGGVVNKLDSYAVGHRIMALFGAPRAHIDDPERAIRAALEMQEAMASFAELDTSCGSFCLKQRIGVNTGLVFAGNVGSLIRQEYSVMGDEVNLTARLMAVADEGQIVISESAARQSGDQFLLREQEPVRVKGKSKPVHNYQVLGVRQDRAALQASRTPFIGRQQEWETVRALTELAQRDQAQILVVIGDVGLGKSRLLLEVQTHWMHSHQAHSVATTCPSFGRHTPYLPWLEILRSVLALTPSDTDQQRLGKIERRLTAIDPAWDDWTMLIGGLLGLDVQETDLIRSLDAQARQRTTFQIMAGIVRRAAVQAPLLLTIDDVQWADETSLELINYMARQIDDCPLLLVLAHRPEESLALDVTDLEQTTTLSLSELTDQASLELLDTLLPIRPQMPAHLKQLILDKARGNPLFIDAMAHSLIENYLTLDPETGTYQARADLAQIEVPDSVQRVIMSRMDRLDESSRNVLRVASVIGQEFQQWLLTAIYPYRRADGELPERLDALSRRDILSGPYGDTLYLFRHILTREVAYESLLYADRRRLHLNIGRSIERQQADHLTEYLEVLAYHFGLAEEWDKALYYERQAGQRAQDIYANEEAVHHYRQALKAAERVRDSCEQTFQVHSRLSEVLDTLGHYDKALEHNTRAQALIAQTERTPLDIGQGMAELCRKAAYIHEKKSDYDAAFECLHYGLALLEGVSSIEEARIYLVGAGIYHRLGQHNQAVEWCQQGLSIAQDMTGRERQSVIAHAYYLLGLIYSRLGDTKQTIEFCQKSLDIYEQIQDLDRAAQAHINLGNGYFDQGEWSLAADHYQRALEIKRRIGDVYHQAVIALNLGGVYLYRGELDRATHYYKESLDQWRELGSSYAIALLYNNMATVALRRKEPEQAMVLLDQSRALFAEINSTDYLPEVDRHMAEAHLAQGETAQALECAQRSAELAQEHDMRLEEAITRRVLGQAYLTLDRDEEAERALKASLQALRTLDSRYEIGQTLHQLGAFYLKHGRHDRAGNSLDQAIAIFQALGARLDLREARSLRMSID